MVNSIQGSVIMGMRDIPTISNYTDLHLQPVRRLHVTIEVIDKNDRVIETIQGLSTGGGINVDGNSLIRRTGNLTLVLIDEFLPSNKSILWMTNTIRVYAGIEDLRLTEDNITHFCLGTFNISEPQVKYSNTENTISITLEDKMAKWETIELENKMLIEADTPLNTAILSLMNLHGEWKCDVEFTDLKVPYDIQFEEADNILNMLTKLRDLYMDWECFYDVDGTFVFRKMNIQRENGEPISWSFKDSSDLIISNDLTFTYKNVKNRVVVIGGMDEKTGLTPRAEANITLEDSPFHSNEIGNKTKVITDGTYSTVVQCDSRARYELFKASTFQEKASITSLPIYFLDANDLIEIRNTITNEMDTYVIDSISYGLGVSEQMTISAHKVYYNHFEISGSIGDYQKGAETIINGIEKLGWLSLAEERISEYFGIEGNGSKLIVRFEYQGINGVTAYVTAYIGEENQTLTIDLADFMNGTGDSGDNGVSKAEYSDRVLGHEMFHAVMNNSFGINKAMSIPVWFKEGMAEFLHGADERLKTIIVEGSTINDTLLSGLVSRSAELLRGSNWSSVSKDYSAGYLISKYLDSKLSTGKTLKNLFWSIKQSTETGINALKKSIVENTAFNTYDEFVLDFEANAFNYVKVNLVLNLNGDEIDTGSVGGSDHRGTKDLNAEDVFDNSKASGLASKNFEVVIIKP